VSEETAAAACGEAGAEFVRQIGEFRSRFVEAMDDDFNTAAGIAVLFEQATAVNRFIETQKLEQPEGEPGRPTAVWAARQLVEIGRLLGLFLEPPAEAAGAAGDLIERILPVLVELRRHAKSNKDFATADLIRDRLGAAGVTLEDRPDGTDWRIDQPAADLIDQAMALLIETRTASKKNKDFATADLIRDRLAEAGITLEDRPEGTIWRAGG